MNQRYNLGLYANCPICRQEMKIYWTDHGLTYYGSESAGLDVSKVAQCPIFYVKPWAHFLREAMYAAAAAGADASVRMESVLLATVLTSCTN
jgi:hypothetical protein